MSGCVVRHDEPVDADYGFVCDPHDRRLRDHLGDRENPDGPHGLAWAWDNLVNAHPLIATAAPTAGGSTSGGSDIGDPETERLAVVVSLRSEIRDKLASWAADVADRAGLAGPADVVVRTDAPPTGGDRRIVRNCQTWLLRNIATLEAHESVAELYAELADLMSRAHALAPWRPPPSPLQGIPCRCLVAALYDHGDEIKCWACGETYTHDQYAAMTRYLAAQYGLKAG